MLDVCALCRCRVCRPDPPRRRDPMGGFRMKAGGYADCRSVFSRLLLCGVLALAAVAAIGFAPSPGFCQTKFKFSSSPNPVGSGARALGMGGAFIAVADDATAASWNPGGLMQLERPEISVVGEAVSRTEDNTFGTNPEASGSQHSSRQGLNYLSAAYPFSLLEHNMILSLNYQHLYDFTRKWDFPFIDEVSTQNVSFRESGGLYAYGLAYCIQINPELSLGFTLNLWDDGIYENGWKQVQARSGKVRDLDGNKLPFSYFREDRYAFHGFNANVGVLWSATSKLTLGAVFKTPFTADLKHDYFSTVSYARQAPHADTDSLDEEMDMPMSYGIGAAYRFSDRLTVSMDIYRTEWGDFVHTDAKGVKTSPISGLPIEKSTVGATTQMRAGVEYLIIKPRYVIPLRAGAFYDLAPAEDSPDEYFGVSVGSGLAIGRFVFDIAYQFRSGNDVGKSLMSRERELSQDISEHTVYSSLIVHF
jgi:long-subunit fatty acid transport protein